MANVVNDRLTIHSFSRNHCRYLIFARSEIYQKHDVLLSSCERRPVDAVYLSATSIFSAVSLRSLTDQTSSHLPQQVCRRKILSLSAKKRRRFFFAQFILFVDFCQALRDSNRAHVVQLQIISDIKNPTNCTFARSDPKMNASFQTFILQSWLIFSWAMLRSYKRICVSSPWSRRTNEKPPLDSVQLCEASTRTDFRLDSGKSAEDEKRIILTEMLARCT